MTEEGYKVTTEKFVHEKLDQVIALAPDCIILDYMWAGDDTGWSFLQMLKMEPKTTRIPVIVCTGAVREVEELAPHFKEMGVQVILKPFDIDRLVVKVKTALPDISSAEALG